MPRKKTETLMQECHDKLKELARLVKENHHIDQREAFIAIHYNFLDSFEANIDYASDSEEDIKILQKWLDNIKLTISLTETEIANYKKIRSDTDKALTKLLPECRMALLELEYIASFYPYNDDIAREFREGLSRDLNEYESWALEDQIPQFTLIAERCKKVLTDARADFLNNEGKLSEPKNQKYIFEQFQLLWQQIKQLNSIDGNFLLFKLTKAYANSKQLESLFKKRAASQINLDGYRKSIVELDDKSRCMPFNFGFRAYLKAQSSHTQSLQDDHNVRIIKTCKNILPACLKMKQFVLTHAPQETVAIVPAPQFAL